MTNIFYETKILSEEFFYFIICCNHLSFMSPEIVIIMGHSYFCDSKFNTT